MWHPPRSSVGSNASVPACDCARRRVPESSQPSCTPNCACARRDTRRPGARPALRYARLLEDDGTSLASCVSTQRTTSAIGRGGHGLRRRTDGASNLAAVAYQNSPSAVGAVSLRRLGQIGGHTARGGPIAARRQGATRCSVGPGGLPWGRCTRRARVSLRCVRVARKRSLLTLAATTGPCHARIAGNGEARWSSHSGSGRRQRATGPASAATSGWRSEAGHRAQERGGPGCGGSGATAGCAIAPRRPSGRPAPAASCATGSVHGARARVRGEQRTTEGKRRASHRRDPARAFSRPPMAASVSTSMRSMRAQPVLDQERTLAHLPQGHAAPQLGQEFGFGRRERQQIGRHGQLAGRLGVDDAGLGVRQKSLRQCRPARSPTRRPSAGPRPDAARPRWTLRTRATTSTTTAATGPHRGWTGWPRPRRPPRTPVRSARRRRRPGQCGLEPRRGAGHEHSERGRGVERGEVEDDQRRGQIETRRRRSVEHAAQVPVDQATELQRDIATVLQQLAQLGAQRSRRLRASGDRRASTTAGTVGTRRAARSPSRVPGPSAARSRGSKGAAETGAGQRGEQLHLAAGCAAGTVVLPRVRARRRAG